jgi:hypothetical protein
MKFEERSGIHGFDEPDFDRRQDAEGWGVTFQFGEAIEISFSRMSSRRSSKSIVSKDTGFTPASMRHIPNSTGIGPHGQVEAQLVNLAIWGCVFDKVFHERHQSLIAFTGMLVKHPEHWRLQKLLRS